MIQASEPRAVTFIRVPAVSPERARAYEKWYDDVHIPLRMNMPGFLGAQRYETLLGRQRYFVLYELANAAATESKEYLDLRTWEAAQPSDSFEAPGTGRPGFERGVYDQLDGPRWPASELQAPIAYVAGHHPAGDQELGFCRWLGAHYVPALQVINGVLAVRQLALTSHVFGPGAAGTQMHTPYPRLITVCYLDDSSVADQQAFVSLQRQARLVENQPDREPSVMLGRLVHTAQGAVASPKPSSSPSSLKE